MVKWHSMHRNKCGPTRAALFLWLAVGRLYVDMSRKMTDSETMTEQISAGLIKGKVIEQRAKLRRNLVSRLFRLGNAVQTQTQQLLALTSDLSVVQFRILLRLRRETAMEKGPAGPSDGGRPRLRVAQRGKLRVQLLARRRLPRPNGAQRGRR